MQSIIRKARVLLCPNPDRQKGGKVKILLLVFALLLLAGCGAISHGTSQNISCATVPAGAVVKSADGSTCSTPCTVSLKRKKDDVLTVEKEGYETVTLPVRSALSKASAGNILLPGGLVCWGVDVISGGGYHLVPERVDITLKPLTEESRPVAENSRELSVANRSKPIFEEEVN
jgi:hypothetical protein